MIFDLKHRIKSTKNHLVNLSVYFAAALIPMILSLVSNPFLAKNLSPEDYAIIGYYGAFSTLFSPLVNFYLIHYYTKRYFELKDLERNILRTTLFKILIFFSCILAGIGLLLIYLYTIFFNSTSEIPLWPYALLTMMSLPLSGIYSLTLADYRMKRQSKKFFRITVANGVIGVALAILLVVFLKQGALGRMAATLLTALCIFVYLLFKNKNIWHHSFSWVIFKDGITFCIPMVIASMLTFFSSGYDKIILEHEGEIVTLGIYSVGVTMAGYLNIFSTSMNDTFQPDIFESIVQRNFKKCLKFVILKLGVMSICVSIFCICAPFIINILTFGRYVDATPYAIIISLSTITSMLYYSMSQITVALGMTKITLTNKIIGSVISIISFKLLISNFGAYGASWGIVLSYLYFFIGNIILVTLKYKKNAIIQ